MMNTNTRNQRHVIDVEFVAGTVALVLAFATVAVTRIIGA